MNINRFGKGRFSRENVTAGRAIPPDASLFSISFHDLQWSGGKSVYRFNPRSPRIRNALISTGSGVHGRLRRIKENSIRSLVKIIKTSVRNAQEI